MTYFVTFSRVRTNHAQLGADRAYLKPFIAQVGQWIDRNFVFNEFKMQMDTAGVTGAAHVSYASPRDHAFSGADPQFIEVAV